LARFIIRRLIQMIGVVFALSLLLFFWLRSLPGGVVSAILGERATPASRAALTEAFGLDQPVWVQYLKFLQRIADMKRPINSCATPRGDPNVPTFVMCRTEKTSCHWRETNGQCGFNSVENGEKRFINQICWRPDIGLA